MDTATIVKKTQELLERAGIEAAIEANEHAEASSYYVNIITPHARLLIGPGGEAIFAIEYLLKRMLEKNGAERPQFFLDVNGYRMHRIELLKEEIRHVAKRVRLYHKELVLKPMSPFERRIIHMALAEYPDIITESTGEGERRRVVVKPYP